MGYRFPRGAPGRLDDAARSKQLVLVERDSGPACCPMATPDVKGTSGEDDKIKTMLKTGAMQKGPVRER